MSRRAAGVIVLILTLAVGVLLPTVDGRRVAGIPVVTTPAPPPRVGDCVLAPLPDAGAGAGTPAEVSRSSVRFGPCSGGIAGEIVGLDVGPSSGQQGSSPGRCFLPIATYAGLTAAGQSAALPGAPDDDPVQWLPTIGAIGFLVVPDVFAREAGQEWAACLATPMVARVYRGGLRDAYRGGSLPAQFGLCWSSADLDGGSTLLPCDQPHAAELLATGWIPDRSVVASADYEASCHAFASRSIGADDPTRGGVISIVTDPARRDGASLPDAPLAVNCLAEVRGDHQLSGTVIGLGNDPIPLGG